MTQEALKLAFEKVTGIPDAWTNPALMQARNGFIQGWEASLSQMPQEPVAYSGNGTAGREADVKPTGFFFQMPKRTWQGLTDEDISEIVRGTHNTVSFVRAIESKLKEKNT